MPFVNFLAKDPTVKGGSCTSARETMIASASLKPIRSFRYLIAKLSPADQSHVAKCRRRDSCFGFASVLAEAEQLHELRTENTYDML